jgi:hypothetical protein
MNEDEDDITSIEEPPEPTYKLKLNKHFHMFYNDPNILYDKVVYNNITYMNYFDIINETFFNIKLFELVNRDYCFYCGYFVRKLGHCFYHLHLLNTAQLIKNANTIREQLNNNEKLLLKLSLLKKIKQLCLINTKNRHIYMKNIQEYDIKNKTHEETIKTNKKYIVNNVIQYDEIIKSVPEMINLELYDLSLSKQNVKLIKKCQNCFKLVQVRNEYRYIIDYLTTNSISSIKNDNSDKLLMEIMKNKYIMTFCKIIERERSFNIEHNLYRVDLFIRLNTEDDDFIDLIIELDEEHHFIKTNTHSDKTKDKYFIENGFSILRIDLSDYNNVLTETIIRSTLYYLSYIIKNNKRIYLFSQKYINVQKKSKKKKRNGIYIKF